MDLTRVVVVGDVEFYLLRGWDNIADRLFWSLQFDF